MTTLALLLLARQSGPTFIDLARDIAAVVRPGDHVITVDDSGTDNDDPALTTSARIARFMAEEGWGAGVAQTTILTQHAGADDLGSALNLALAALAVPGALRDHVVVLAAGSRLSRDAFIATRQQVESAKTDLAVLPWQQWSLDLRRPVDPTEAADWPAREGEDPGTHARRIAPPLQGIMIGAPLLEAIWSDARSDGSQGGEGDEGRGSHGDLALVWQLLRRAQKPFVLQAPVGHRPAPPDPGPELIRAAADLCTRHPDAATWVADRLPRWLDGVTPGARAAILTLGPELISRPADMPPGLLSDLLHDPAVAAASVPSSTALATPQVQRAAKISIYLGPNLSRSSPFGHPSLTPLWEDHARIAAEPLEADLILWSDPRHPPQTDVLPLTVPQALFCDDPAIVAEYSPDPLARDVTLPRPDGTPVRLHQIAHHRSPAFSGGTLPYALLIAPDLMHSLARQFATNATLSAQDWRDRHATASHAPAPPTDGVEVHRPEGDLYGLRALQRAVADLSAAPSWQSALEAVHQPDHLSARLFSAFAAGKRPLYAASPGHRLHRLGLPSDGWLNLWSTLQDGATPKALHDALDTADQSDFLSSAYAETQKRLAALFADRDSIAADRHRLGEALRAEITRLVAIGPA